MEPVLTAAAKTTVRLLLIGAVVIMVSAATPAAQTLSFTIDPVSSFSAVNVVQLSGAKDAGSTVTVQPIAPATTSPCAPITDATTSWSCVAAVPNGAALVISAIETLSPDSMTVSTTAFDVLGPPTINGSADVLTTGIISGQGYGGSTVTAKVANAPGGGCSSLVASSGYWSCSLAAPSGHWSVTTTQTNPGLGNGQPSSVSGSLDVLIDKDSPAPPVITSPRAGSRVTAKQVSFAGSGEAGGTLDLYLDNVPVCSSVITGAGWSCTATAPTGGTHSVLAIQRDAAGNFSRPSAAIRVYFGARAPGASAVPVPTVSATPTPLPSTESPAPVLPQIPHPTGHLPVSGWATPTGFGSLLPSLSSSVSSGNVLWAPLLALGFLALVALPLRLLASALRGRGWHRPQFLGRNQARRDAEPARPPMNPWLAGIVPFTAAVALILFSGPLNDEVRYLRLALAVSIGLALLTLIGVLLPSRFARRRLLVTGRMRLTKLLVLASVVTAALSRIADIHPRLIAGVLIGTAFTGSFSALSRAVVRLAEVSAVTVIALIGWIGQGLLVTQTAFGAVLAREVLATLALAGLGSALVMVLPIASLPGRAILEWSVPGWLATVLVVAASAAVVYLGAGPASFPMIGSLAVAAAFAALSVSVWAWIRFVEPVIAG